MAMKIRRIDFYADDWLTGTRGMTHAECGLYWNICALMYAKNEARIEIEEARRIFDDRNFDRLLGRLLTLRKLTAEASLICCRRVAEELQRGRKRTADASQASRKRWENKETSNAAEDVGAILSTINQQPSINNHQIVPNGTRQSARQITEWMVEIWKEVFGGALSTPAKHNENRIRTARARFVGDFRSDIGEWRKYLERIRRCPWLMGAKAKDGWRADFDWVLKPANLTKVMEGRYDDHAVNGTAQPGISLHRAPSGPPPTLEGWEVPMDRTH